MPPYVSVGKGKVIVRAGDQVEPDVSAGEAGVTLASQLKQKFRDAARKVKDGAKAAIAANVATGSGTGVSVQTSAVNGKTHVVVTKGTKTLERNYDQAVKVTVTGQNPSVVRILDRYGKVVEEANF